MGQLRATNVSGFAGLDLRLTSEGSAPNTLRIATNVDVSTGGSLRARDQLRQIADVTGTFGLYVVDGLLRCAYARSGATLTAPPGFAYDVFSNTTGNDSGGVTELTGAQGWNNLPYIVLKRGARYEHHFFDGTTRTQVDLPYLPGPNLFAIARKLWGHDIDSQQVWYSSSINGPRNWTESGDAGYLPVSQHAPGDSTVRGFGVFGNKLCVFFKDTVQIWSVFTDPADNELVDVIGGAGTVNTYTIANVLGDPIYFARGGFRTMSITTVAGQTNDSDVGAPIYPETKTLDLTGLKPVAVWSSNRAQYMCAIGSTMYVYTNSPQSGRTGWTKYSLPYTVTDMVELDGDVFIRAGNAVYVFDSAYSAEPGFSWTIKFPFNSAEDIGVRKQWIALEAATTGTSNILWRYWPRDETITQTGPRLIGSTFGINHIPIGLLSESLSLQLSGTGNMTLDGFTLRYRAGNP